MSTEPRHVDLCWWEGPMWPASRGMHRALSPCMLPLLGPGTDSLPPHPPLASVLGWVCMLGDISWPTSRPPPCCLLVLGSQMALWGCGPGRGCSDTQAQYTDYPQVTHRTGIPSCDSEFEQVLENKNETSSRITFLCGGCESEFAGTPHHADGP